MHTIFESNPNLKKAFITSDGTAFYQEHDAKNHAKTLEDKSVEPVYNEKELQVIDLEDLSDEDKEMAEFESAEKLKADQEAEKQQEVQKQLEIATSLLEFDLTATKYPEALKLFKALGLEAENEKKETIYPLLVAAQEAQTGANTPV